MPKLRKLSLKIFMAAVIVTTIIVSAILKEENAVVIDVMKDQKTNLNKEFLRLLELLVLWPVERE
jgi:hypothetical protein